MKTISFELDDDIFGKTEVIRTCLKQSRDQYFIDALDFYNKYQRRLFLERKLLQESQIVREDSMAVLKDFEEIG